MAQYKNIAYLNPNQDKAFDAIHKPGDSTPHSGIYRCEGCGREIVSESGKTMPPQNHHQHSAYQGEIRWRLIVRTE